MTPGYVYKSHERLGRVFLSNIPMFSNRRYDSQNFPIFHIAPVRDYPLAREGGGGETVSSNVRICAMQLLIRLLHACYFSSRPRTPIPVISRGISFLSIPSISFFPFELMTGECVHGRQAGRQRAPRWNELFGTLSYCFSCTRVCWKSCGVCPGVPSTWEATRSRTRRKISPPGGDSPEPAHPSSVQNATTP